MRHFLIPVLLLSLVAGCSSVKLGPHRIDVQQGNALDQENVARLKPGLNRSQVRFLLGTPLVVDPFRTDRWDYVYVYYKAGKLAEQKHISLFFEGDTLARIEGDLPEPAAQPAAPAVESKPEPQAAAVMPAAPPVAAPPAAEPAVQPVSATAVQPKPVVSQPAAAPVVAAPVVAPLAQPAAPRTEPSAQPSTSATSVVPPLPSPKNAPPYVDPRTPPELSLQPETDVAQIKPDVIPPFPESSPAVASDSAVMNAVNDWAAAWARHDTTAYFAAYDDHFVPQDGRSRADWEKRQRQAMKAAKSTEIKVDSPSVERAEEGTATVTFRQVSRTGNHRDVVTKRLLMVERDGRWLIVEENLLSTPGGARP